MTEYELVDAAGTYHDIAISTLMAYFSVLCGYLLVAYLVGARLTRLQTIVITGLYLVMQLFMVWGTTGYLSLARSFMEQADSVVAGGVIQFVKPQYLAFNAHKT